MNIVTTSQLERKQRYAALVSLRKECRKCNDVVNPSSCEGGRFDQNGHVGPWSDWQGNLDAELMVIGQEWGGTTNYTDQRGRDLDLYRDTTNKNLVHLLGRIGLTVQAPSELQGYTKAGSCFFTNGVLCLRKGAATSGAGKNDISEASFTRCGQNFLRPQIEIIRPRTVLVLGKLPWIGLMKAFDRRYNSTHKANVEGDPVPLNSETIAIALFHCGSRSINMNRDLKKQSDDWARARPVIERTA